MEPYSVSKPVLLGEYDPPTIYCEGKPVFVVHYGGSYGSKTKESAYRYADAIARHLNTPVLIRG